MEAKQNKAKQSKQASKQHLQEKRRREGREMGLKFAGRKGGRQMKFAHAHIVCPAHLFSCSI
jgi:hypothetical protein